MSRPPPPPGEPPSPPQPQTRKRCLKQRDEGEPPQPPSNLRLTAPSHQKQSLSADANSSDSDARTLPPHKKNPNCGLAVAEKYLPNGKFSGTRFQGGIARGSGGCFSPAVGKEASYFCEYKNVEDLNVNEGYDGDCEDVDDDNGDVRKHIFSDAQARAQALRATSTFMVEQMAKLASAAAEHKAKFERRELEFNKKQEAYKVQMAHQKEQREFLKLQSERELMTHRKEILSILMKKQELTTSEKALKDKIIAIIDGSKIS